MSASLASRDVVWGGEPPFPPPQATDQLASTFVICLSANGWKDQNMASSFPAKENPNMEKALFDWPIVLQYDIKAKYRLNSRKF